MKKKKGEPKTFVVLLIGIIIFLIIILGLGIYKINLMTKLEQDAYNKVIQIIMDNQGDMEASSQKIERITAEFEEKKQTLDKDMLMNSIKGFLITLTVVFTGISKVVENTQSIILDLISIRKKTNASEEEQNEEDHLQQPKSFCIPVEPNNKGNGKIKEVLDLIQQVNEIDKEKLSQEKKQLIEKTLSLLMDRLVQIVSHTGQFTTEMNEDRAQLTLGISEIKKGVEHINQRILDQGKLVQADEDVLAAIEQIHTVIEEIGLLLLGMDRKVKRLTLKIDNEQDYRLE